MIFGPCKIHYNNRPWSPPLTSHVFPPSLPISPPPLPSLLHREPSIFFLIRALSSPYLHINSIPLLPREIRETNHSDHVFSSSIPPSSLGPRCSPCFSHFLSLL